MRIEQQLLPNCNIAFSCCLSAVNLRQWNPFRYVTASSLLSPVLEKNATFEAEQQLILVRIIFFTSCQTCRLD